MQYQKKIRETKNTYGVGFQYLAALKDHTRQREICINSDISYHVQFRKAEYSLDTSHLTAELQPKQKEVDSMLGAIIPSVSDSCKTQDGKDTIRRRVVLFFAEFFGMAIVLFVGCMGCVTEMINIPVVPHLVALTFGFSIMIAIQIFAHVSGAHVNPQVSVAALILGKLDVISTLIYVLGQFLGATAGFAVLKALTPEQFHPGLCETNVNPHLTLYQAVIVETILSSLLVMTAGAVFDHKNARNTDSLPVRFGLTVAALAMVGGPFTGASMNSARSLAPALVNGSWKNHWIYWLGPTSGAITAAVIYKFLFNTPDKEKDTI